MTDACRSETSCLYTSENLYHALLHGAAKTREKREELNRINVFPVVDNDTGSNLAHTMQSVLTHSKVRENVRETLREIARSALLGARGNSGAIFSQYFQGLYHRSHEKGEVTLSELATYFREAYEKAYRALETPVEGTVITLMRAWYLSWQEGLEARRTPQDVLESALARIRGALEETRNSMKVLKAAGVVDAGALGYYHFMEGFVQVLLGRHAFVPQEAEPVPLPAFGEDVHVFVEGEPIPFRYCAEVLLEAPSLDEGALRESLKPLGDCLLVSTADNLARVHLHTDAPWEVVRRAAAHGLVLEQKADDMVQQNRLAGPPTDTVAVVTDSIADLPPAYIHQQAIYQIPINVLVDGVNYLDKLTIDGAYLAQRLGKASSSQLNTEQVKAFLQPILRHHREVLVLTVSSHMSGTHARFKEALAELDPDGTRTALVDTRTNSGAQGLLVREAVARLQAGQGLRQAADAVEAMKGRAKILVSVLDIEPMARSGRVSERIGDLLIRLRFKPMVTIDREGKGTIRGVAFSAERNRKILLKALRRKAIEEYVLVHAGDPDRAESFRQDLVRMTGKQPLYVTEISAVVTLFAGRGSVAVAFLEKEPGTGTGAGKAVS